ncbi:MAG: histone deacetylase [Pirellulaceae bacterium]
MTRLYTNAVMQQHLTGRHPECPARLDAIDQRLKGGLPAGVVRQTSWSPVDPSQLQRIHPSSYQQQVQTLCEAGGGALDPDTIVSQRSHEIACLAAGAVVDAVDHVLDGHDTSALCLVRPPGHHALAERAMGFCLFNNIAIAAINALQEKELNRLLIIDWDVHHGNGTQDLFWTSPQVGFYSVHRWPFYPGSGDDHETGSGDGLGTTCNLPLPMGISRQQYLEQFERTLVEFAARINPELILISAGFDSHYLDPVGSLGLESSDFGELTRIVQQIACSYCDNKIVSVLEGGYHLEALAESVQVHLQQLASPNADAGQQQTHRLPENNQVQGPDRTKDQDGPK